jgi:hypothetical protein
VCVCLCIFDNRSSIKRIMDENINRLQQTNLRLSRSRNEKLPSDGNFNRYRKSDAGGNRPSEQNGHILGARESIHHVMRQDNKNNNQFVPSYPKSIPVVITDDDGNECTGNQHTVYENIKINRSEDDSNSSADDDYYREGSSDDDEYNEDYDEDSRQIHPQKFRRSLFNGQQHVSKNITKTNHSSNNNNSNKHYHTAPENLYVETALNGISLKTAPSKVGRTVSSTLAKSTTVERAKDKTNGSNRKDEAIAYLLRYETMVRQQEAEDMAVVAHLAPCLLRLEQLIRHSKNKGISNIALETLSSSVPSDWMDRVFTYSDLNLGLEILKKKTNERQGHQNQKITPSEIEFMTTDRQFMMILKMLATTPVLVANVNSDADDTSISEIDDGMSITWLEIIQCYKVCITGMVALEHIPTLIARSSESVATPINCNDDVRARTRERTLDMLTLFRSSLHLKQFYRMQQHQRRYISDITRIEGNERFKTRGNIAINKYKSDRLATLKANTSNPRSNKSWFGSLILFAVVTVFVAILRDKIGMMNVSYTVFPDREMIHETSGRNTTIADASFQGQKWDRTEKNNSSLSKDARKNDFKNDKSQKLHFSDVKDTHETTNTVSILFSPQPQNKLHSVHSSIGRSAMDLALTSSAESRQGTDSVRSIAMASAAVVSTAVVPLLIGQMLPAIFVPVAVVTVVSVPFLVAMNRNVRTWLLIRFAHFRQQNRKILVDLML